MLVTSLTSAIAFIACSFTPIMPLKAFGIFAALIVPTCFLLTITAQPVVYFIYEMYFMSYQIPGFSDTIFRYKRLKQMISMDYKELSRANQVIPTKDDSKTEIEMKMHEDPQ